MTITAVRSDRRLALSAVAASILWVAAYRVNAPLWRWLVGDVVGLDLESRLGSAVEFFFYDVVKIGAAAHRHHLRGHGGADVHERRAHPGPAGGSS
jgi:hypothetical protein